MKVEYCGQCEDFACSELSRKLIDSHPNHPKFNYRHKIPDNMDQIDKIGLEEWAKEQKKKWLCPDCNNQITFYDYKCISCGKEWDPQANEL